MRKESEEYTQSLYRSSTQATIEALWEAHSTCTAKGMYQAAAAVEDIYRNYDIRYTVRGPKFNPLRNYDEMQGPLYTDIHSIFTSAYDRDMDVKEMEKEFEEEVEAINGHRDGKGFSEQDYNSVHARVDGVDIGKMKIVSIYGGADEVNLGFRGVRTEKVEQPEDASYSKMVRNVIKHDFSHMDVTVEKLPNSTKVSFTGLSPLDFEVPYSIDRDAESALRLLGEMDRAASRIDRYQKQWKKMLEMLEHHKPNAAKMIEKATGIKPKDQKTTLKAMLALSEEREEELTRFTSNTAGLRQEIMKASKEEEIRHQNEPKSPKKGRDIDL